MTPEFTNATLPLILYVLNLFDRVTAGTTAPVEVERRLLRAEFDAAAAKMRGPRAPEWELASYALAAVVDEMLIVDIPWAGQSWWENLAFEVELFNTRRRATECYAKADQASASQSKASWSIFSALGKVATRTRNNSEDTQPTRGSNTSRGYRTR